MWVCKLFVLLCVAMFWSAAAQESQELKFTPEEREFCEKCLFGLRGLLVFPSSKGSYAKARNLVCTSLPFPNGLYEAMHFVHQYFDCRYSFFPRGWRFEDLHNHRYTREGEIFKNGTYLIRNNRTSGSDRNFPPKLTLLDFFLDREYLLTPVQLKNLFKGSTLFNPHREMREKLEEYFRAIRRLGGFAFMG